MKVCTLCKLALPFFVFGCLFSANAQVDRQGHTSTTKSSYQWNESTDSWYMPKAYSYRYSDGTLVDNKLNPDDRGPIYLDACKQSANPSQCTENFMKARYINVYEPDLKYPSGYSGVEYVSFDIDATGKATSYMVVKQPVTCEACAQAAVNRLSSLSVWQPAIRSGQPTNSTIVVPVYFNTKMPGDK